MAGDDLDEPLGLDLDTISAPRDVPWGAVALAGIALLGTSLLIFNRLTDDAPNGEPFAVSSIERLRPPPLPPKPASVAETSQAARSNIWNAEAEPADTENGVRVVRNGGGGVPGSRIIQVPGALGVSLSPAPDRRLVEKSAFGLLPKIGPDGARPADVYARPVITGFSVKAGAPRIALVVGGMGISQSATQNAMAKLPGAVTLAFAPYGAELEALTAAARAKGHELMLQVPMESFDGASPGPHVLQVGLTPEQNLDHLHWSMARFAGYVGIANFLGAKFTADDAAIGPVLRDAAGRGLLYLDDGSSNQSVAPSASLRYGLAPLRADVVLDSIPRGEGLDAALSKLEALARDRGSAIGIASALPGTVDRLADFAAGLERRGIALVPLSALAVAPTKSAATMAR